LTHFLHFHNSNTSLLNLEPVEELCARAIEEMLGFFGSKLIFPERNIGDWKFSRYDCLSKKFSGWDETYRQICDYTQDNLLENLFSHQQGYSLGENLFWAYLSGNFSKNKIKKLFCENLCEYPFKSAKKFLELKYCDLAQEKNKVKKSELRDLELFFNYLQYKYEEFQDYSEDL